MPAPTEIEMILAKKRSKMELSPEEERIFAERLALELDDKERERRRINETLN